ncbi:5,10-methylenetetrahydromethanopterin reductase [Sphingobium faniae]|nr:5,10-methylenetetrahydromethanopterin reductase [Sphingobium faniae]
MPEEVTRPTELWTAFVNRPFAEFDATVDLVDGLNFDGLWVADSQNIMPEAWVLLSRAAVLSSRLKLGTFVTNPVTRHAAVTASAAATLQEASKGRVVLGLGRGDSSLAYIGSGPMKLGPFSSYLDRVQGYLRGDAVSFDPADVRNDRSATLESLAYGHAPEASRIEWLPSGQSKVPLDVATSGPRVIAMAAAKADGVTFGLGVDRQRIADAMGEVRRGCLEAGRDPAEVSISALVSVVVHPDRETAQQMAAGSAASIARWQVMQGAARVSASKSDYEALDKTRKAYDMTNHGATNTSHSDAITPEMIDRFAIAGPPDYCIGRLRELKELGLARLVLPYRSRGTDPAQQKLATELLTREVLPAVLA